MADDDYYLLDPEASDPRRIKKEREKAQKLKKSQWWRTQLNRGICHYCGQRFPPSKLTMDHIVPIARGGTSTPGNVAPACVSCNRDKKLETPVDALLKQIASEKKDDEDAE